MSSGNDMNVQFESDFQKKILFVSFPEATVLETREQLDSWKQQWVKVLKSWHSPYKALIDFSNVQVDLTPEFLSAMTRMFDFLKRFFLRKVLAWGFVSDQLPFECVATEDEARNLLGLGAKAPRSSEDFRSMIHIENHFEQKNVELSFQEYVVLTPEKLAILRSKMTNNLMQWHSHWQLLVDCSHLEIPAESFEGFEKMVRFFKGFFLEEIVGYSPASKDLNYPFPVFRSRHKAAAKVKSSGKDSGRDAHCKTSK